SPQQGTVDPDPQCWRVHDGCGSSRNVDHIGTEHLPLGLMREGEGAPRASSNRSEPTSTPFATR
ncbi:MAG TPA: hypothetical protein VIK31_00215, partial [Propionibacteriaceae bacterium]